MGKFYIDAERPEFVKKWRKSGLPVVNEIRDLFFSCAPKRESTLEGAINYTRKVWGDLLAYLDEPYLEQSNDLAERCVKPFVVNRKLSRPPEAKLAPYTQSNCSRSSGPQSSTVWIHAATSNTFWRA